MRYDRRVAPLFRWIAFILLLTLFGSFLGGCATKQEAASQNGAGSAGGAGSSGMDPTDGGSIGGVGNGSPAPSPQSGTSPSGQSQSGQSQSVQSPPLVFPAGVENAASALNLPP